MVLIFGIVFFILAKFGFPMITGMVERRAERIDGSIAKAKEAEEKLSRLAQEHERMIEESRREQVRILEEASHAREEILARAKQEAADEADKILLHAQMEIDSRREAAMSDLRRQVAELSVDVAEKILRRELSTDSRQQEFMESLLDEASKMKTGQ